jgi:hypothetical protein
MHADIAGFSSWLSFHFIKMRNLPLQTRGPKTPSRHHCRVSFALKFEGPLLLYLAGLFYFSPFDKTTAYVHRLCWFFLMKFQELHSTFSFISMRPLGTL